MDRYVIFTHDPKPWHFTYVVVDTVISEHGGRWVHQTNSLAVAVRVRDELNAKGDEDA